MRAARIVAAIALALIAAGAFEPFYFRMYVLDRPQFAASLRDLQYRKASGLRRFYTDVRRLTAPGERVAVFPTFRRWDGGYDYIYSRAFYHLTGREVLELVRPDDQIVPQNLGRSDVVAAWHAAPEIPGFRIAARTSDGTVLRRIH